MTTRPWMPLYVADYLADTAHLTAAEHGAYLLLIMHYWAKGGLPEDEAAIARITRLTSRQWAQSRDVLWSLFGNNWRHRRIDEELSKAIEKSKVNSANAKRRHSERKADAQRTHTQPQPQSDNPEAKASVLKRKRASDLSDDWQPSEVHFAKAADLGISRDAVLSKAEDMRLWARSTGARKVDWDATFHGFIRRDADKLKENGNGKTGNVIAAADRLLERVRAFDERPGGIRDGTGTGVVRLLSER